MTDVATDCDECHGDIAFGETCYAVRTGEQNEDGQPFVRILCASCRDGSLPAPHSSGGVS